MTGGPHVPTDVAAALSTELGIPEDGRWNVTSLSGGCIHPAVRIDAGMGRPIFVKWAEHPGVGGFGVEARGLDALREADGPIVPEVLGFGEGSDQTRGWLALTFVEPGPGTEDTPVDLGAGLARLHRPLPTAAPGWHEDGFIGPLEQSNRTNGHEWCVFWREARLEPIWESVQDRFPRAARDAWGRVIDALPTALDRAALEGMSLLHGDLWSGNVLTDRAGSPVLIDPAVYIGDREVDLAMMDLFGGFASATRERYDGDLPVAPGYSEIRRDVYQLYPLLVHVRLFGQSYVAGVVSRLDRILGAIQ